MQGGIEISGDFVRGMGIRAHLIGQSYGFCIGHHLCVRIGFPVVRFIDAGKVIIQDIAVCLHRFQKLFPVDRVFDGIGFLEFVDQVDMADFFRGQLSVGERQRFLDRFLIQRVQRLKTDLLPFLGKGIAVQIDTEVFIRIHLNEMDTQNGVGDAMPDTSPEKRLLPTLSLQYNPSSKPASTLITSWYFKASS